jgi:serine/threonine-protein kinase HipA
MTSRDGYSEAYIWIWLPNETVPVVAGRLTRVGKRLHFTYDESYLERKNANSIYDPELPLQSGELSLQEGLSMPSCIRDASPDAWGRRVLINYKLGLNRLEASKVELEELTYLLESGSDRIGALDFQVSATEYVPRVSDHATLEELIQSAERMERGTQLVPDIDVALLHNSSLGGARPKALFNADKKKFIAKFSTSTDPYNIVKAEFLAMRLAHFAGINVADVHLTKVFDKDVLLIERFDREKASQGWTRKPIVSALTLFGLNEMMAKYASYQDLAEIIRHRFANPAETLCELYRRVVFNVLCGNTDDHARNHSAFWDGNSLTLTPAYDVCPQPRTGNEASQAMLIHGDNRMSQLSVCLAAAPNFLLDTDRAKMIIQNQVQVIRNNWNQVCDEAQLTGADRQIFWRRQFLNPFAFYGTALEVGN